LPQLIAPHEPDPEHSMSHPFACAQSMSLQAPALLHRTVHSNPSGHSTEPHGWLALHSIRHVRCPGLQELHTLGHWPWPWPSTQNPWSQIRPPSQSPLLPQT
jgi:hypothetical protein